MPRSASVSIPRRQVCLVPQLEGRGLVRASPPSSLMGPFDPQAGPREYDSWPCDSFFLLPDSVLAMDAGAFRADLNALDPVLSASLPDWEPMDDRSREGAEYSMDSRLNGGGRNGFPPLSPDRRGFSLLHNHEGLTVRPFGKGTVLIGSGSDSRSDGVALQSAEESSSNPQTSSAPPTGLSASTTTTTTPTPAPSSSAQKSASTLPAAGVSTKAEQALSKDNLVVGDGTYVDHNSSADPYSDNADKLGVNELFFGSDRVGLKDREDRVRVLRDRQQAERLQKLEELKEHALSAQRFREQQEQLRRTRLEELRAKDMDRRSQVEERKKMIHQAELERKESVLRKAQEREQRLDHKRRQERSNVVFAFGSSTPRMLDPKENKAYWTQRRATSTSNVNMSDSTVGLQSSSDKNNRTFANGDLSRKRATSAHSLNRKGDGEDMMTQSVNMSALPSAARRRTDLLPTVTAHSTGRTASGSPRHKSPGFRSGNTTPVSTSRPNSALSQGSSGQVIMRTRTTPRKPRPLSIAGSAPSKSEKRPLSIALGSNPPSGTTTPNRESRSIERKLSAGAPVTLSKPLRAKSAGSDNSAPATPSKSAKPSVPKRTPAQVKAENAAKKAALAAKARPTPKSPSDKSAVAEKKILSKTEVTQVEEKEKSPVSPVEEMDSTVSEVTTTEVTQVETEQTVVKEESLKVENLESLSSTTTESVITVAVEETSNQQVTIVVTQGETEMINDNVVQDSVVADVEVKEIAEIIKEVSPVDIKPSEESSPPKTPKEKPVTGYATEEDYKAVLAEKRRQAREQKEREQELERQRELDEEERIRKEEEDYLLLMEDQKKAEEERLAKAIEEANKQREVDAIRKEEEEKQRVEAERIENEKRIEAEEKLKREEEERQLRKSRVAAIMARTRGASKSKSDAKTPDESKSIGDSLMTASVNDALLANMTNSMTDSMIVRVIETHQDDSEESKCIEDDSHMEVSSQPRSDISSQPTSGVVSDAPSDVSSQPPSSVEFSSQLTSDFQSDSSLDTTVQSIPYTTASTEVHSQDVDNLIQVNSESLSKDLSSLHLDNPLQINGNAPSTTQEVDLLASFNEINTIHHNGMSTDRIKADVVVSLNNESDETFDQIIDLSQTKLSNEDSVNSNNTFVPQPIIAFEDNLNLKQNNQNQDSPTNVPDLLL